MKDFALRGKDYFSQDEAAPRFSQFVDDYGAWHKAEQEARRRFEQSFRR